jgi:uncharacterized membrane protein YdbT with pleckstrin-like domain
MSDEQVIYRGSPSLLLRAGPLFLSFLLVAGGVAGAFLVSRWFLILSGLALVYAVGLIVAVKSRVYEFTTERVRLTQGIFSRRTDELELYRVKDTSLVEPFLQRVFKLGDIEITTTDASTPMFVAGGLRGARELREKLRQHIEECRARKRVRLTELE